MQLIAFLWKMFNDALLTRNIIYHNHVPILQDCALCYSGEPESLHHLYFQCSFARVVWFGSPLQIRSDLILAHGYLTGLFKMCLFPILEIQVLHWTIVISLFSFSMRYGFLTIRRFLGKLKFILLQQFFRSFITSILLSHKYWRTCFNLLLLSSWKKNLQSMKERRRRKRGYLGVKYAMCLCVKYADNELWRRASWMRV